MKCVSFCVLLFLLGAAGAHSRTIVPSGIRGREFAGLSPAGLRRFPVELNAPSRIYLSRDTQDQKTSAYRLFASLGPFGFAVLAGPAPTGRTYFVANAGDDSNDGLTVDTPWRTIAKVNAQSFLPGDTISFNRGD